MVTKWAWQHKPPHYEKVIYTPDVWGLGLRGECESDKEDEREGEKREREREIYENSVPP